MNFSSYLFVPKARAFCLLWLIFWGGKWEGRERLGDEEEVSDGKWRGRGFGKVVRGGEGQVEGERNGGWRIGWEVVCARVREMDYLERRQQKKLTWLTWLARSLHLGSHPGTPEDSLKIGGIYHMWLSRLLTPKGVFSRAQMVGSQPFCTSEEVVYFTQVSTWLPGRVFFFTTEWSSIFPAL